MRVMRKVRAALMLLAMFAYDIVVASVAVARVVLAPNRRNAPAIVAVPVDATTEWGVVLFAYLVSLTPGSTTCTSPTTDAPSTCTSSMRPTGSPAVRR